jgi:hypothetical protein
VQLLYCTNSVWLNWRAIESLLDIPGDQHEEMLGLNTGLVGTIFHHWSRKWGVHILSFLLTNNTPGKLCFAPGTMA